MKHCALGLFLVLLTGCQQAKTAPASGVENGIDAPSTEASPDARFSASVVASVMAAMRKEPKIVDFIFDPELGVSLQVAVLNDGTGQFGYARYLCMTLRDLGASDDNMAVRVVDAARLDEAGGDFRSISLAAVWCKDGSKFG